MYNNGHWTRNKIHVFNKIVLALLIIISLKVKNVISSFTHKRQAILNCTILVFTYDIVYWGHQIRPVRFVLILILEYCMLVSYI